MDQTIIRLNKLAEKASECIEKIGGLPGLSVERKISHGRTFTCEGGESWEVSFRYELFGAILCRWYLIQPSEKYNHVLVSPHISNSDIIAVQRYNPLINQYPREVKVFRARTKKVQNYLKSISGGYETDHVSAFKDKAWIIDPEKFFNLTPDKVLFKS